MKGRILISEEEKRRILQMHISASKGMYLKEQTEPDLGFAVGNEITIKNITIPGLNSTPGDLTVYVDVKGTSPGDKGSSRRPKFTISNVLYNPPLTVVDANKGLFKNSKGETIKSNLVSAAAGVNLTISCELIGTSFFSFILSIKGGDAPTVSTSNFKETNSGYDFQIGQDIVNKTGGAEKIKNILGKIYNTEAQNIAKSIFGSQDWVKNAQKLLPQS